MSGCIVVCNLSRQVGMFIEETGFRKFLQIGHCVPNNACKFARKMISQIVYLHMFYFELLYILFELCYIVGKADKYESI